MSLKRIVWLIFFSVWMLASHAATPTNAATSTKKFPESLSDTNGLPPQNLSAAIKTPEYVIIRAREETTLSSETTGRIIYLPVKDGSAFQRGMVLLKMDCRLQEADLKKAIAEQKSTSKALSGAKKLKQYGTISEFEYVKTASDADAANADVDKLRAIADKCTMIAPFSGGVAQVKVHLYETVKPGDPLLKVTNTENLFAEVQVPSTWLSWLHEGTRFNIYVNDINESLSARVNLINPEIEPISQTVKISGLITPPDSRLRPGMTGQASFPDNPDSMRK